MDKELLELLQLSCSLNPMFYVPAKLSLFKVAPMKPPSLDSPSNQLAGWGCLEISFKEYVNPKKMNFLYLLLLVLESILPYLFNKYIKIPLNPSKIPVNS